MTRLTKIKKHLTLEEIDQKIKATAGFWRIRRWMIIRHAAVEPTTAEQIAKLCGVKKQTVSNLIAAYNKHGASAVETAGKGQRQKAYLSLNEEKEFLNQFMLDAKNGHVATIKNIHESLEKLIGSKIHESTVYRMLARHGWRKIMPRPTHAKANQERRETFKKTSVNKSKKS